ncbi:putative virus X resistance protein-like, coiled-coil [Helianthus annuus]|nr:putative virus X resistance protein-like, coiled-coil [Helianthus annuus]
MAEAPVIALLQVIFEKLSNEALKTYVRSHGIHSELNELEITVSHIQALLNDASHKEITDESVGLWLNSLQHLAYDIDDVLDDVATEAIHHELAQEDSGVITDKVRKLIPSCCTNFSLSHRLHEKLDSITTRLQHLEKQKADLGLIVKDEKQKDLNRGNETSLLESDVVGREVEKEKLLNKLLCDDLSKENFSVLPIVGMGGVGKTTLARLLFNDTQVKDHFELKVWVCVSDDFDIFKISNTIFQSITRENKKFEDLNQLQLALTGKLKDKRFLLVLDDVWTESYDNWENLVRPFHLGAPGSKIIMTTRKEKLLKKLGFDHLDHLESLSGKDALTLLALHALGVNNFDSHPTLKPKGEGIVEKCGGLALALKAIGRLLRTKTDEEKWDDILNSKMWESENVGNLCEDWKVIVPALRLSYHDLSADLKRLFAYCSLFPKDYLFKMEDLVLLWMAEGFLNHSNTSKSQERLGRECFEELLSRSFFQPAPNMESWFVMHDLMNDLATYVAGEYFLRFDMDMEEKALVKYRHMSFLPFPERYVVYQKLEAFKKARSLRTFLIVSPMDESWNQFYLSRKILIDLLPGMPLLRVLSLRWCYISEVPDFIGSLKHLRYLNLSHTEIKELPEDVGNLYNLQTLIVFCCEKLTKLPNSFSKLKKLRHFDMRGTSISKKLPLGIGELKSLHTITNIIIGRKNGFAITELKGLKNIQGEISIEGLHKVQSSMQARDANLSLKRLTKLELKWDDGSRGGTLEMEVLNELKPNSDWLENLKILSYGGREFPKWVGDPCFNKLVHVSIHDCRTCTSLPQLGLLPSLKELFIQGMDEVEVIGSELTGTTEVSFPSLELLRFVSMPIWEVWSTNNVVVFPCLREIHIEKCPKLIDVSLEALPSLRVLQIDRCGESVLRSLIQGASSITILNISYISGLTYEVWRGVINSLRAVEEVRIYGCHEIRYFWESEVEASKVLVNLKKLSFGNCSNLVSLGEKEEDNFGSNHPSSLRILEISYCNSMENCHCPNSIENLRISGCSSLTCVSFPTTATGGGQNLKNLDIQNCDKLMENINNTSMPMLETVLILKWTYLKSIVHLSNFLHLTSLYILHCPSIESFPDLQLSNLTNLMIEDCQKMESFPDLRVSNLTSLSVKNCPILDVSFPHGNWPPKLVFLCIGGLKKPITEWGPQNYPTSLVNLQLYGEHVSDFSQLSNLLPSSLARLYINEFDKLESLSIGLHHLTSLERLYIYECPKMKHLPKTLLPSLLGLFISRCRNLKERCNGRGSHYWPLISHIPCIDIH